MIRSAARWRRWLATGIVAGGAVLAVTLTVRAANTTGTDPPSPAARQESIKAGEEQRAKMKDDTAGRQQAQPKTTETVNDTGDGSTTQVTVNGESVTVPANGSYHRTTDDGTTHTDVHVSNRNRSSETGNSSSNHSSSNIRVNVRSGNDP